MWSALGLAIGVGGACTVDPLDLSGRRCPCVAGYVCVDDRCVAQDAADATASDRTGETEPPCTPVTWPARPATDPGGTIGFVSATRELVFRPSADAADFGVPAYDLDGHCACPGPNTCTPRTKSPSGRRCDPSGADDALGDVVGGLQATVPGLDLTARIAEGRFAMLFRVAGYNGLADDPNVTVELLVSTSTDGDAGAPRFDGTDVWTVTAESVTGPQPGAAAKLRSIEGYVAGGVLVAVLEGAARLSLDLPLDLRNPVVVARVESLDGGSFSLGEGRVGARIALANILTAFGNTAGSTPLCPGDLTFEQLKSVLCANADLPLSVDAVDRAQPCDAISAWLAFRSNPASLGTVIDVAPRPSRCDAGVEARCD